MLATLVALATPAPTPTPQPGVEDDGTTTSDVWNWITGVPLRIGLIVVVAFVSRWFVLRLIDGVVRTMTSEGRAHERPGADRRPGIGGLTSMQLLNERRRQRAQTMGSLLRSIASVVILGLAFVMILGELGVDLGPLIAAAGVAGIALGFGAQALVRDFLSGVFMILEDQYGVGDVIDTGFAVGAVEEVALRVTRIRDVNGVVWYVRNGEIMRIGNRSQGWSLASVDMPIAYDESLDKVRSIVATVAEEMLADPDLQELLLEAPTVAGVESVAGDAVVVRVTARSAPQEGVTVSRELRERLKHAFDDAQVRVPVMARPYPGGPGGTSRPTGGGAA